MATFGTGGPIVVGTDNGTAGSSRLVWTGWVTNLGTTSNAITINTSNIWNSWNLGSIGTGGTIATNTIWNVWAHDTIPYTIPYTPAVPETPEQAAQRELNRQMDEARWMDQTFNQNVAKKKARKLLGDHLSDDQKRDLEASSHFFVRSKSGRLFKVKTGKVHNVIMVHPATKEELLELCVTAYNSHELPEHDIMLAQKLWLEHLEEEAIKTANIWDLKRNRAMLTADQKLALALQAS